MMNVKKKPKNLIKQKKIIKRKVLINLSKRPSLIQFNTNNNKFKDNNNLNKAYNKEIT